MRSLRRSALHSILLCSLGALTGAAEASAQCPRGGSRTLFDGGGERWDFNPSGTVATGSDGAFEGMSTPYINGTRIEVTEFNPPVVARPDGRGYEFQLVPVANVILRRQVYVPTDRRWVRYIDILQFVGMDPEVDSTVITYDLQTNTGYEDDVIFDEEVDYGEVVTTFDGDRMLEASDRWFSYDNVLVPFPLPDGPLTETAPRAFCQTHWHPDGSVEPMSISAGTGYGCGGLFGSGGSRAGTTVRYRLTVTRTVRVAIMHFAVQGNRATVNSGCAELTTLDPSMYQDLDDRGRAEIVNWLVPVTEGECDSILDCDGDFCVDGVCCDAPCIGGDSDCQACSIAAGGMENGVCTPIALGRTCRGATGACDRPERCDGSSPACPANLIEPNSVVCRAPVGGCDVPEFCTGTSILCPSDRIAFAGTVCRASLGGCQPAGRCDGTTTSCPAAVTAPDGAPCDDGLGCTYATCSGGFCTSGTASCDDGDICTTDSCAATECTNAYMPGCVGGRDAGAGFDGGGGSMNFPDVPMDVGVTFDQDAPGFDAPYDGPLPWDQDVDPDFDGGPNFDGGGGGLRDGEVPMDGSMTADVEDRAEVGGGGCMCRSGGRSGGGVAVGIGMLVVGLIGRRRR